MGLLRAWTTLVWISFRQLLWSWNTLIISGVLLLANLAGMAHARFELRPLIERGDLREAFQQFSRNMVIDLWGSFLIPVAILAFATASIGGDREDRTLVFLLVRPIPRWLVFLGKMTATVPLAVGLLLVAFYANCRTSGEVGAMAWSLYTRPVLLMSLAYLSLFHLFSTWFRHSTIVALLYALFFETLLGNLPGMIKHVAISFYGRSVMFDVGAAAGLRLRSDDLFVPVSRQVGNWALLGIAAGGLLWALMTFQRREYRDLT